jgi:hypothetical protein
MRKRSCQRITSDGYLETLTVTAVQRDGKRFHPEPESDRDFARARSGGQRRRSTPGANRRERSIGDWQWRTLKRSSACRRKGDVTVRALMLSVEVITVRRSGDVKGTIRSAVRLPSDIKRSPPTPLGINQSASSLLPCHAGGRGFESRRSRHSFVSQKATQFILAAALKPLAVRGASHLS